MTGDNRCGRGVGRHDFVVRTVALLALAAWSGYLAWRSTDLLTNAWLSIPLFMLEVWGLVHLGLLTSQGWNRHRPGSGP